MLWIKRNLFLAVGGLLGLLFLAGGVFYFVGAQGRSKALDAEIEEKTSQLGRLQSQPPFPSPENIEIAKRETDKLRAALGQLNRFFVPVSAEKVTGVAFRAYRDRILAEMQARAKDAKTTLPSPTYAFSFETQKPKTDFKEGTFPAIPQQMAEVDAITKVLFNAHVSPLINVRRAKVSRDDEESTAQADYVALRIETNAAIGTVTSPYEVTFHCLSSDLAAVLQGFAQSPHGFIVKAVHVDQVPDLQAVGQPRQPGQLIQPPVGNQPNVRPQRPGEPPQRPGSVPPANRPVANPNPAPRVATAVGVEKAPVYLLRERRLNVTLLIYAIKAVK